MSAKSTVSPVASSVRIQIQNLTLFLGGSRSGAEGHLFIVDVVVEYVQWNHVCALIINKTLVQSVLALDGFFPEKFSLCKQFFISRELFFSVTYESNLCSTREGDETEVCALSNDNLLLAGTVLKVLKLLS